MLKTLRRLGMVALLVVLVAVPSADASGNPMKLVGALNDAHRERYGDV